MAKVENTSGARVLVGIDISRHQHDLLIALQGKSRRRRLTITNSTDDFMRLIVPSRMIAKTLADLRFSRYGRFCARFGMGMRLADFSSQAGNDDVEDRGCDPSEHRPGMDGCGTLWDFGVDGLKVAQA